MQRRFIDQASFEKILVDAVAWNRGPIRRRHCTNSKPAESACCKALAAAGRVRRGPGLPASTNYQLNLALVVKKALPGWAWRRYRLRPAITGQSTSQARAFQPSVSVAPLHGARHYCCRTTTPRYHLACASSSPSFAVSNLRRASGGAWPVVYIAAPWQPEHHRTRTPPATFSSLSPLFTSHVDCQSPSVCRPRRSITCTLQPPVCPLLTSLVQSRLPLPHPQTMESADAYDYYTFDHDKYMFSSHSGKQRTKREVAVHTNRFDPSGHSRKISTKIRNTEKNARGKRTQRREQPARVAVAAF